MSRFWFAIFRNPSTLYTLRFLPWNSGIYWRLHSKPVNASQYVIWHLYPFFSIPISEPTHVGAKPISEPFRCPRIPMSESYQCQSYSNEWALPMSEHTNVKAIPMYEPYQCRSQTDVRAFQCPSQCCVQPLVASTHFWTEQTTPTRRIAMYSIQSTDCHVHVLLRNYNWQNMTTT